MLRFALIALSLTLASSLRFTESRMEQDGCAGKKCAYITMWIDRSEMPEQIKQIIKSYRKFNQEGASTDQEGFNLASTEQDGFNLMLTDQQQEDAMFAESRSDLARFTNHLSGKDAMWELAGNLAHVNSKYPLLILTNEKQLLNQTEKIQAKYTNVKIVELKQYLVPKCHMRKDTVTHLQKLNILGMDEYDKLLWIDADVRLRKPIDNLFDLDTENKMHFMKDDWYCNGTLTNGGFSSGLLLFKPTKAKLDRAYKTSGYMGDCWGDQVIMQRAFGNWKYEDATGTKRKMQMKHISGRSIRYPQCDRGIHADAIHFVKVKKGFVQPAGIYKPPDEDVEQA